MRNKVVQMSLMDACDDVYSAMEYDKPKFLAMLEEHIDFS